MNILFVCTGNTCRSPMAEGLMNQIAQKNDVPIAASSAGIFTENGIPVSQEAVEAAAEYGVDISSHQSQRLTQSLAEANDLILTMTAAHKQILLGIGIDHVYTIKEYAGEGDKDISDPYGGDLEDYRNVCRQLYDALLSIAEKITEKRFSDRGKQ